MNHAIHPKPEGLDRLPVELLRKVPPELFENIPEDFMETLHKMIGSRAFESEELKQGLKEQVEGILKQTLIVSSGNRVSLKENVTGLPYVLLDRQRGTQEARRPVDVYVLI
jgi:uncharacterized protein YicC (UPF0701 family)